MCLLIDKESLKTLLKDLSAFDLKVVMALAVLMEEDLHLGVRLKDLGKVTGAAPLSLRHAITRLETAGLILVKKRGHGPGAKVNLVVSPGVACDPHILPGFETGFDKLQDVCWIAYSLARRSLEPRSQSPLMEKNP